MTIENKQIIEINGVKMEIDLREAKTIDTFRVGDYVKVLAKNYDNYETADGVIIGFYNFNEMPTIRVLYAHQTYNNIEIKVISINNHEDKYKIVHADDKISLKYSTAIDYFDRKIQQNKIELAELESKKEYYVKHFGKFLSEIGIEEK